jgi:hypothetical protein
MEPASLSTHLSINDWLNLRLALGLLLLMLSLIVGIAGVAMRAWLRLRAAQRASGAGLQGRRHRSLEASASVWPPRRVTMPLRCDRRPWRAQRR